MWKVAVEISHSSNSAEPFVTFNYQLAGRAADLMEMKTDAERSAFAQEIADRLLAKRPLDGVQCVASANEGASAEYCEVRQQPSLNFSERRALDEFEISAALARTSIPEWAEIDRLMARQTRPTVFGPAGVTYEEYLTGSLESLREYCGSGAQDNDLLKAAHFGVEWAAMRLEGRSPLSPNLARAATALEALGVPPRIKNQFLAIADLHELAKAHKRGSLDVASSNDVIRLIDREMQTQALAIDANVRSTRHSLTNDERAHLTAIKDARFGSSFDITL